MAGPLDPVRTGRAAVSLIGGMAVAAIIVGAGPRVAAGLLILLGLTGAASGEAVFTLAIFGALLMAGLIGGSVAGERAWRPGERSVAMLGFGLGIGAMALIGAVALTAIAGTLRHENGAGRSGALLAGAAVVAFQVVAEEVFFRGWLQPALARAIDTRVAVGVVAIAFAALHLLGGASGPVAFVNLALGGVLFGVLAARGGGVAGAVGAHFGWNALEQLGLGLDPNPGTGSFGAVADFDLAGAALWGGSPDALNASLAMTFALLTAVVPLMVLTVGGKRAAVNDPARRVLPV